MEEIVRDAWIPESANLLLAKFQFVTDLPGVHDELGLHLDKVFIVGELFFVQILPQDLGHEAGSPVDALL